MTSRYTLLLPSLWGVSSCCWQLTSVQSATVSSRKGVHQGCSTSKMSLTGTNTMQNCLCQLTSPVP